LQAMTKQAYEVEGIRSDETTFTVEVLECLSEDEAKGLGAGGMGLFDGVKRALGGGASGQRPSIRSNPWRIGGDDIVRQYKLSNFDGQSRDTVFQILCNIEMGSFGFVHYHMAFGFKPAVLHEEGYTLCLMSTIDGQSETGVVPLNLKMQFHDDTNMFLIEDAEVLKKRLAVLNACKPMQFMLMNNRGEGVVKIQLDNDTSYRIKFNELQDRVVKSNAPFAGL
jgi:hypothetical protein